MQQPTQIHLTEGRRLLLTNDTPSSKLGGFNVTRYWQNTASKTNNWNWKKAHLIKSCINFVSSLGVAFWKEF